MIINIGLSLGITLLAVCCSIIPAIPNGNYGLPAPTFSINLTQDNNVGLEKHVFRRLGAARDDDPSTAPMFEGLGTHYSFIWVGTPAQRVSVIMDTGSHHTAFPCTGCKCGKHMDPHFDPKQSSSSSIKSCGGEGKKCYFKQSYTEGSSWSAFKVRDKVWVGGPGKEDIVAANARSIDFDFGCQESETGLFRTQKVDGIMGLSAAPDTLPFQLHATGLTQTKMFGLCFRTGGGVVTFGGVDTALHLPPQRGLSAQQYQANRTSTGGVLFAQLLKPRGWYTVKLLDVLMRPNTPSATEKTGAVPEAKSIGGDTSRYNAGKGTIVDSGTTDTYLPASLRAQFQALFRTLTGKEYGNKQAFYSKEQFAKLPVIVFRLMGAGGVGTLDLEVFPTSYMEHHKEGAAVTGAGGRYTPRIYLTEGTGAVLGANAIHEHNVIFDPDGMRVGFARSHCTYDKDHSVHDFATSTNAPTAPAGAAIAAPKQQQQAKDKVVAPVKEAAVKKKDSPPAVVPKPPSPAAVSVPKKDAPKAKYKPVSVMKSVTAAAAPKPGTGMLFPVELTIIQKEALSTLVEAAAEKLINARHAPCRPVLAMPCNARCDRQPGPESQVLDFGMSKNSESRLEYLRVDSAGTVSVGSASVIKGQQYWKVPSCDATSRRTLQDKTTGAAGVNIPADWTAVNAADKLGDALDAEDAEELRVQQLQHRIVSEQCAVVCPLFASSGEAALDAERALPVRVNAKTGVDHTTTACDAGTQTRKRLIVRNALVDTAGESNVLTLASSTGGDSKVLCFSVLNAKSVSGAAPTTNAQVDNSENNAVIAPAKCKTATVEEETCRPYFVNCTASAKLTGVPVVPASDLLPKSDVDDVVVAVHMRLKGLHYSTLPAHHEADLINAFASIFKVRTSSVSLTLSPPAVGFSFSSRSQTAVLVVMRINPAATDGLVSAELLQMVARISANKKSAKKPASAVQRSLMSAQVAHLVRAVVMRPLFPELLAAAVADAPVIDDAAESARPGWLVAGGITFVGVNALHGDVVGANEQAISDKTDADICAAASNPWKEYFALAGSSLLARADLAAQATGGHTALLYSVISVVIGLGLLAAGVVLARRYFREKERTSRENTSVGSSGGSGRRGVKSGVEVSVSSPSGGSDESDLEASVTPTSSQKSNLSAHRDRRRKVLQKFSFKR